MHTEQNRFPLVRPDFYAAASRGMPSGRARWWRNPRTPDRREGWRRVTTSRVRVGGHVGLGVGEATHDLRPIAILAWRWSANGNLPGVTPGVTLCAILFSHFASRDLPPSSRSSAGSFVRVGRNRFPRRYGLAPLVFPSNLRAFANLGSASEGNRKWK